MSYFPCGWQKGTHSMQEQQKGQFIETCKISEYNFIENNKLLQHINFVQGMVKL